MKRKPQFEPLETRRNYVVFAWPTAEVDFDGSDETGVVMLESDEGSCTGTLLSTGRHILTAAHCVTDDRGAMNTDSMDVTFERDLPGGGRETILITVPRSAIRVHPGWDGWKDDHEFENDVAILQLPEVAPPWANRHSLYREKDELRQTGTVVGYGNRGNGVDGEIENTLGIKLQGENLVEFDDYNPGFLVAGSPGPAGTTLAVDLTDDPTKKLEAIGAHGDSGGPLLLGGRVAGVYSTLWGEDEALFDFDYTSNADLDDVGVYMRVSHFAPWIDGVLQEPHPLGINLRYFPFANDGVADNVSVFRNASGFAFLIGGTTFFTQPAGPVTSLTILGSDDSETFNLPMDAGVPITVNGGIGTNVLATRPVSDWVGTDRAFTATIGCSQVTYAWDGAPLESRRRIGFSYISRLEANTGRGDDEVYVQTIAADPEVVVNAGEGADKLFVGSVGWYPATLNGDGGDDVIRVGEFARTLDGILSRVTVNGGTGSNTLVVNDSRDTSTNSFTINSTRVQRGAQVVDYRSIQAFELYAGTGADSIVVNASPARLLVDAGGGLDTVQVALRGVKEVTVRAGAGGGNLKVDNASNSYAATSQTRYSVSDTAVTAQEVVPLAKGVPATTTVQHAGFAKVELDTGVQNDLIRVLTTPTGPQATVRSGGGNDIVVGGAGNDILHGESGRDLLMGGSGTDILYGGSEENIIIGDRYTGSATDANLLSIMAEWSKDLSYATRVQNTRRWLTSATVTQEVNDVIFGGENLDWFWVADGELKSRQTIAGQLEIVR
jgi:Ca2+-binding RTX toxin-like protein